MFEIDEKLIVTTEQKMLYNIMEAVLGNQEEMAKKPLKRQDLMKAIAKFTNKPSGWNKWSTDKMREFYENEVK